MGQTLITVTSDELNTKNNRRSASGPQFGHLTCSYLMNCPPRQYGSGHMLTNSQP